MSSRLLATRISQSKVHVILLNWLHCKSHYYSIFTSKWEVSFMLFKVPRSGNLAIVWLQTTGAEESIPMKPLNVLEYELQPTFYQ